MTLLFEGEVRADTSGRSGKRVILYSLTRCCAEASWPEAETEFEKELRALHIHYTRHEGEPRSNGYPFSLVEAFKDNPENVAALFFYKRANAERAGVHIAIFEHTEDGTEVTQHSFEMGNHEGAGAVVTLKAVEAVHAAFFERPIDRDATPAHGIEADNDGRASEDRDEREPGTASDRKGDAGDGVRAGTGEDGRDSKRDRPHFGLGAHAVVFGGPSGVGPMFGMNVSAEVAPFAFAVLELSALFTLYSRAFEVKNLSSYGDVSDRKLSRTTLKLTVLRTTVLWNILRRGRFHPLVGVVGGFAFVRVESIDRSSVARDDTGQVAFVGGDVRLVVEVLPILAVVIGGKLGVFVPEVRVASRFTREGAADVYIDQAVHIGRPLAEGMLGLRLRF